MLIHTILNSFFLLVHVRWEHYIYVFLDIHWNVLLLFTSFNVICMNKHLSTLRLLLGIWRCLAFSVTSF